MLQPDDCRANNDALARRHSVQESGAEGALFNDDQTGALLPPASKLLSGRPRT